MQNRGNFVLNKARYLMNIDDTDLCVYSKNISGGGVEANTKLHSISPPKFNEKFL